MLRCLLVYPIPPCMIFFFFSSRRRHTRCSRDWSSDVCSSDLTYQDLSGVPRPYLTDREVRYLTIPKGSLDETERLEIESHVNHTYSFLKEIPWTRELHDIPLIAYGHHEKLDGHGYPRGVTGDAIPVQTRMMTISDIYDALTAADRPYKSAVAPARRS